MKIENFEWGLSCIEANTIQNKKGAVFSVQDKKVFRGSGGISLLILNLGTR